MPPDADRTDETEWCRRRYILSAPATEARRHSVTAPTQAARRLGPDDQWEDIIADVVCSSPFRPVRSCSSEISLRVPAATGTYILLSSTSSSVVQPCNHATMNQRNRVLEAAGVRAGANPLFCNPIAGCNWNIDMVEIRSSVMWMRGPHIPESNRHDAWIILCPYPAYRVGLRPYSLVAWRAH